MLPQEQPGLDGLAESHLVGEEVPRLDVRHDPPQRLDLVSMEFHRGGRQRGQPLVDGPAVQVLVDESAPAIVVPT